MASSNFTRLVTRDEFMILLFAILMRTTSASRRSPVSLSFIAILLLAFAAFSSTAKSQTITPTEIGTGIIDRDRIDGPRWTRIDFDPLITGDHTVRVTQNTNANVQFSIFQILDAPAPNDKVRIGTTINSATPNEWTGTLDISKQYYMGILSLIHI